MTRGNLYFGWFSTDLYEIGNRWRRSSSPTGGVEGINPVPHIHEQISTANYVQMATTLRTPLRIITSWLSTMRWTTRTPSHTRTCTTRSSEHAAHRPLIHSVHIALWFKIASCIIHVIHACALVVGVLSCPSSSLCFSFSTSSHCSSSSSTWCPTRRLMRSPWKITCATPAWWAWSRPTTSHPSQQEKVRIHCSITIWFTSLFLCLKLWKFQQQKQQWTRNGKIGEIFGVELDKSQK